MWIDEWVEGEIMSRFIIEYNKILDVEYKW